MTKDEIKDYIYSGDCVFDLEYSGWTYRYHVRRDKATTLYNVYIVDRKNNNEEQRIGALFPFMLSPFQKQIQLYGYAYLDVIDVYTTTYTDTIKFKPVRQGK